MRASIRLREMGMAVLSSWAKSDTLYSSINPAEISERPVFFLGGVGGKFPERCFPPNVQITDLFPALKSLL